MKLKLPAALAAALLLASGGVARAEANGWYGALDFGYHWPDNFEGVEVDNTWLGVARLGYRWNPAWRFELEGAYRPADIQSTSAFPDADGDVNTWSLLANGYYDFLPYSQWRPFIGAGVGWAHPSFDIRSTDPISGDTFRADDDDNDFAWQVMAGVSWVWGPLTSIDLTYRHFQVQDASVPFVVRDSGGGFVDAGTLSDDLSDNSVTLGLRYSFAPPPPGPPPPPGY